MANHVGIGIAKRAFDICSLAEQKVQQSENDTKGIKLRTFFDFSRTVVRYSIIEPRERAKFGLFRQAQSCSIWQYEDMQPW